MEVFFLTLGERLRQARENVELSQVQVKEKTGINNKTLSNYENGVSDPDPTTLKVLADLYGVSADWLISGKESNFKNPIFNSLTEEDRELFDQIMKDKKLRLLFDNVKKLPPEGKDRVSRYVKIVEMEINPYEE